MNKFAYRRSKLKDLIASDYNGVRAAFGRATGIDPTYVSRLLYEEGKPGFKRISDEIIEKIDKVHPNWLATGKGNKELGAPPPPALQLARDPILDDLAVLEKHEAERWRIRIKAAADERRLDLRAAQEAGQQQEVDHRAGIQPHDPHIERRRASR